MIRFRPFDSTSDVERNRRRLPHWSQNGCTYFVTFRLADSLPRERREALEAERADWLEMNGFFSVDELLAASDPERVREYRVRYSDRIEEVLDSGLGSCLLERSECSSIVEGALRHFDLRRYNLDEYVVMPNHVHCVVSPRDTWKLSKILHSWKRFTAREINRLTGGTGTSLWLEETFDHVVRSEDQLDHFRRYIRENPRKAHLRTGAYRLGTGESGAGL